MARFEVFIPAQDAVGFDMTFRVEADNWMAALKTGMQKVGQEGPGGNILCDIKEDNSIHVTDPASAKVFRIRELSEVEAEQMAVTAPVAAAPLPPPPRPAPEDEEDEATDPNLMVGGGRTMPAMPAMSAPPAKPAPKPASPPQASAPMPREAPALPREAPPVEPVAPIAPKPKPRAKAVPRPVAAPPARPVAPPPARAASPAGRDTDVRRVDAVSAPSVTPNERIGRSIKKRSKQETEEVLADLFERSGDIAACSSASAAMNLVLDLAMEKIPSDSGSVYSANISAREISFAAARGPKANELMQMKIKLPVGVGLAGVAVQEGVGIAISDAHKDPRFFKAISAKLGYETRSVVTVPIQLQGQVMGAIQLINRKQGSSYSEDDLSILAYLAHQAADYLRNSGAVTL